MKKATLVCISMFSLLNSAVIVCSKSPDKNGARKTFGQSGANGHRYIYHRGARTLTEERFDRDLQEARKINGSPSSASTASTSPTTPRRIPGLSPQKPVAGKTTAKKKN